MEGKLCSVYWRERAMRSTSPEYCFRSFVEVQALESGKGNSSRLSISFFFPACLIIIYYCWDLKRSCVSGQEFFWWKLLKFPIIWAVPHWLAWPGHGLSGIQWTSTSTQRILVGDALWFVYEVPGNVVMSSFINNSVLLSLCLSTGIVIFMVL